MNIQLTPFDALNILKFLKEFEGDMDSSEFESLKSGIKNFSDEIYLKITDEQIDDAYAERSVSTLLGKFPE